MSPLGLTSPWTLASGLDAWPDAASLDSVAPADLTALAWAGADGVLAEARLTPLLAANLLISLENGRLGVPWQLRAVIGSRIGDLPPLASARLGRLSDAELAALAGQIGRSDAADRAGLLTSIYTALTTPRRLADVMQRLPGETVIELLLLLDLGGRPIDPVLLGHPQLQPHLERLSAVGLVFKERGAWFVPMDVGLALGRWRAAYLGGRLSTSVERCRAGETRSLPVLDAADAVGPLRAMLSGSPAVHAALMQLMRVPQTVDALLAASGIAHGLSARPLAAKLFASILGRAGNVEADRVELTNATAGLVGRWLAHVLQTVVESLARLPVARAHPRSEIDGIVAEAARWVSAVRWFERVEFGVRFAATPPIASCAMLLDDATVTQAGAVSDAVLTAMRGHGLADFDGRDFALTADLAGAFEWMIQGSSP